jgi:hypothetical protein
LALILIKRYDSAKVMQERLMPSIYISYRPRDANIVEQIAQRILLSLGRHSLQMNPRKSCPTKLKLDYHIESMMHSSEIVLIVIGEEWAGIDEFGRFRLSSADIPLHNELKNALQTEREVLVLLIDGAELPPMTQMPDKFHGIYNLPIVRLHQETLYEDLAQFVPAPTLRKWLRYCFSGIWTKRRTIQA